MKLELTEIERKSNFNKLLVGLIEGEDVNYFSVDKGKRYINFLFGEYNVTLYENGKWEIG